MPDAHLLLAEIATNDRKRRLKAMNTISSLRPDTAIEASVFVDALSHASNDVVMWSAIALEHLGERGNGAIPALLPLLARDEVFLRQVAIKALGAVGPSDQRAKAAIFEAFADSCPSVRREALQASIGLGDLSEDDLAVIAGMANDSDESVARWSEITLRNRRLDGKDSGQASRP